MENLCRFLVRLEIRIGLVVAWVFICMTMGMWNGFVFAAICAAILWYARTALGESVGRKSSRKPPQEDFVRIAARSAASGPSSIDKMDPAWRAWLKRESDIRPDA